MFMVTVQANVLKAERIVFILIHEFSLTITWNYTTFCHCYDSHNFTR